MRVAGLVQSRFFDGVQALWYHPDCFLKTRIGQTLVDANEIHGYNGLRWDDQEKIKKKVQELASQSTVSAEARREGYRVEYAKSGKSMCRGCEEYIGKGLTRLSFLMDSGGPYGPAPAWHHVECFFKYHPEKGQCIEDFSGWENLEAFDIEDLRERFKQKLPSSAKAGISKDSSSPNDAESLQKSTSKADERRMKSQTKRFWQIRDGLSNSLLGSTTENKEALNHFLKHNDIFIGNMSESDMIDLVADTLCFGVTEMCPECCKSRLIWKSAKSKYVCPTHLAWGSCAHTFLPGKTKLKLAKVPKNSTVKYLKQFKSKSVVPRLVATEMSSDDSRGRIASKEEVLESIKNKRRNGGEKILEERANKKARVLVKGRSVVDSESGLAETHHILEHEKNSYNAVLAASDIASGRNSFYTIQALEGDWIRSAKKKSKKSGFGSAGYYIYRKWGRVGTSIGGDIVERCDSKDEAMQRFQDLFFEKTGNYFGEKEFVKKPKMFYPMELSVPTSDELAKRNPGIGKKSKLPHKIQDLLKLIFDVEAMKRAMMELEIDLEKMPLGQLSKKQIHDAYQVLGQAQSMILKSSKMEYSKNKMVELTNQFFTLIPHNFGRKNVPLLDNEDVIKSKLQMLETLMEIEIATSMMEHDAKTDKEKDVLDVHYESLGADIHALNEDSEEFKIIKRYLESTHAPTHTEYKLQLKEVYALKRHEEYDRYKTILDKKPELLSNRKLLWHGSRITNYVGIISQGLRIAPPEAPVTGYMFGKGVYFADMASKSANYCNCTQDDPEGLLLLSEVALGPSKSLKESNYIEKLPKKFSSVKGCGKTVPSNSVAFPSMLSDSQNNAKEGKNSNNYDYDLKRGSVRRSRRIGAKQPVELKPFTENEGFNMIECPMGPPKQEKSVRKSELLYNEYIVYDVNQILTRYLVRVKFQFIS